MYLREKSCTCGKHNYDISKEGYLNLVHNKATAGDSKSMMVSRRDFLEGGFYEPISNTLNELVLKAFNGAYNVTIADMGCGEGYYLSRLSQYLMANCVYPTSYGLDLSKTAIKLASQTHKDENWLVANLSKMPFQDGSIDCAMSMFANLNDGETYRVLKDDGYLILVRAGLNHLLELRQIVYPKIIERYTKTPCPNGFTVVDERTIKFSVDIKDSQNVKNLLIMTPHYWKVTSERRAMLYALDSLYTTAEVEFYVLKKLPATK
jgi:23S rRNA (guanine745-N1)-methyltransferase